MSQDVRCVKMTRTRTGPVSLGTVLVEREQAHTRAGVLDGYIDAKPTTGPVPFAALPLPLGEATPDVAFESVVLKAEAPWSSGYTISRTRAERSQQSDHSIGEWRAEFGRELS